MTTPKDDIQELLHRSDVAELMDNLNKLLPDAKKVLVALAQPDGEGLRLRCFQLGHEYSYEVLGFIDWVRGFMEQYYVMDDDLAGDDEDDS